MKDFLQFIYRHVPRKKNWNEDQGSQIGADDAFYGSNFASWNIMSTQSLD